MLPGRFSVLSDSIFFCMSLDQLSIAMKLPARTDLVLLAALGTAGHLTLLRLDHLFDHISAYGSVLFGSQVSVVSVCKRNTQLVCYLIFETVKCALCLVVGGKAHRG